MSYRDEEWLTTCAAAYNDAQKELIPLVQRVFNVQQVMFVIVDPEDYHFKLMFQYRGLDVTAMYISGAGEWFMTVEDKKEKRVYFNNVPWQNIEFDKLFDDLKQMVDLINY
jgi:hypothetical protein